MTAIRQLDDHPIIIRTVDLGADKFTDRETPIRENNPFLGLRSMRYCMENPELLKTQLRAILRASAYGNVKVMFPLISSLEELLQAKSVIETIMEDFDARGEEYDQDMQIGTMIEVPSAAISADILAEHCDFFSIGTNDLIQYTLAVDRANEHVAKLYQPEHPAVLRLIKKTIDDAHAAGIPVGLCGEMGSAIIYTVLLLGLELDSLSVAPAQIIPEVKKIIRNINYSDAQALAQKILEAGDPQETKDLLEKTNRELLPDLISRQAQKPEPIHSLSQG
jgi:phosphotransferase system enzyme I (PtsI)